MEAGSAGPVAMRLDQPLRQSASAGRGLSVANRSDRHHYADGSRHVANGRYTGGTGTLSDSGTHHGGPPRGGCPWGEDGPQAPSLPATGRPCKKADRTGGTPRYGRPIAQCLTANALPGVAE